LSNTDQFPLRKTEGSGVGKSLPLAAPFLVVAAILFGIIPLVTFAWNHGGNIWPDAYVWRVTRFTLLQATLSTLLSIIPAIVIARALARQDFPGKSALLILLAVPQALPVIIAIFGITALYGQAGVFGGWLNIYGLIGILLVHVFFNLPLATRLFFEALQTTPTESHRLAAQLNFSDFNTFKTVDWPAIKSALPHVAALIFLLCAASFITVLVLGGPQATTLEVAIYQSLRMDFDVSRALTLSVIQIVLSGILVWLAATALTTPPTQYTQRLDTKRYDGQTRAQRVVDRTAITVSLLLVLPVYLAILWQGLANLSLNASLFKALATSLAIAALSMLLTLLMAWGMAKAHTRFERYNGLITALGLAGYIVPPAVIATGWFLVSQPFNGGLILATKLIAFMNVLMALPFALATLNPAIAQAAAQHDKLCAQLGIMGWNRFRYIEFPSLRSPLAQAALMAFVLSLGDLTAVTLLGSNGLVTLPSLVQQQMGHYAFQSAGGTALMLAAICVIASFASQRLAKWT
jgi:thiamine transport system permease protein